MLSGLTRGFKINFPKYLSPYGATVVKQVANGCLVPTDYPGLTFQKMLKPQYADYTAVPVFANVFNKMIMSTDGTPREPLLLVNGNSDGTGDGVMIAKDVQELAYTYCQRGVSVQFHVFDGLNHIAAAVPFEPMAVAFLTQRLSGLPVTDGCSSITPGNALTPLPVRPAAHPKAPSKKKASHRHHRRAKRHQCAGGSRRPPQHSRLAARCHQALPGRTRRRRSTRSRATPPITASPSGYGWTTDQYAGRLERVLTGVLVTDRT